VTRKRQQGKLKGHRGMHILEICLILLALTCLSSSLTRWVKLPLPLMQILVGTAAALPPFHLAVTLDPHLFLFLFIPPLLFADGWRLPQTALKTLRWPVLGHAVGLVLFTIFVGGYTLHWLIPAMPLSVAFAVAALVSPTDAVAVSAIIERVKVPPTLMHLLESESMLNDASGLVALKFAVAATLGAGFSLLNAAGSFLFIALGGLVVGWLLTFVYYHFQGWKFIHSSDAAVQTVLLGLLPFAAYALAEALGLSGILAAVSAGLSASKFNLFEEAHFSTRMQAASTSNVISFCFNGAIFVLLGLQLPSILGDGPSGINLFHSNDRLAILGEIVALSILLVILRLVWVLVSAIFGYIMKSRSEVPGCRIMLASSLAGVRGAITLAGALSLPNVLPDGESFPSRDLAITLATGVVLCSMLTAAVLLPLFFRAGVTETAKTDLSNVRITIIEAAIEALSRIDTMVASHTIDLIKDYRARLTLVDQGNWEINEERFYKLYKIALKAERMKLLELRRDGRIDDVLTRQILGEIDSVEAALERQPVRLIPIESKGL